MTTQEEQVEDIRELGKNIAELIDGFEKKHTHLAVTDVVMNRNSIRTLSENPTAIIFSYPTIELDVKVMT